MSVFDKLKKHAKTTPETREKGPEGSIIADMAQTEILTPSRPDLDPILAAERIGIKHGNDTPETLGEPIIFHANGHPLAYANDLPHVRLFAWSLLHLWPDFPTALNRKKAMQECQLTERELDRAIRELIKSGDLVRKREGRSDLFTINAGGTEQ